MTASVMERCAALNNALEQLSTAAQRKQQAAELTSRRNDLRSRLDRLTRAQSQLKVFRSRELGDPQRLPLLNGAQQLLIQVRERLDQSPDQLTAGQDWRNLLKDVDRYVSEAEGWAQDAWKNYVAGTFPTINDGLMSMLANLPTFKKDAGKARELNTALQDARRSIPKTAAEIEKIAQKAKELQELLEKLNPEGLPDEVKRFLKSALSNQGADLEALTPGVLDWLKKNKLLTAFKIRGSG